jgi:hypothetical protein
MTTNSRRKLADIEMLNQIYQVEIDGSWYRVIGMTIASRNIIIEADGRIDVVSPVQVNAVKEFGR